MKLKLPLPPVPKRFQSEPPRPGEEKSTKPLEQAAEVGISAVDWIDERTSLAGGLRWVMFRKVPKGTNWFYTLGSATMFAFLNQAVTGVSGGPPPGRRGRGFSCLGSGGTGGLGSLSLGIRVDRG